MRKFYQLAGLLTVLAVLTPMASNRSPATGQLGPEKRPEIQAYRMWSASIETNRALLAVANYHHRGNVERFFGRSTTGGPRRSPSRYGHERSVHDRSRRSSCVHLTRSS